jgi:hypothetical protein
MIPIRKPTKATITTSRMGQRLASASAPILLGLARYRRCCNNSGSFAIFTAILRASSRVSNLAAECRPSSHYLLRFRRTIELRSYIKPELGELQVGLARFVHVRVARPFETFVCHDTVLRSRLHENAPTPTW